MKKLILTIIAVVAISISTSAQIVQIKSSQLPAQARTTIRKAWNGAPIVDAWRNKIDRRVEYKASVEDGSTIKFDANGRWIEMKSYSGVPTKLLPPALVKHVDTYYEGRQIVWVIKTAKRYQIELTDGSRLEFNAKGIFQAFL